MTESATSLDSSVKPKRALALDALRGYAILTMVLSGVIPYGSLPAWMYHAQVPPPLHKFDGSIPGVTWVDLVFPFFLFALGAAIPLALSRRIARGASLRSILLGIAERGFLLGAFAVYVAHIRPWTMNPSPTTATFLTALIAFALLFPMYARIPGKWSAGVRWGIRLGGWLGAIVLMALVRFPDGSGFSKERSDIIIVLLTNAAVFASLIWLLTRGSLLLRLGSLGVLMAIRLASHEPGWVHAVAEWSPIPWMYHLGYLQYLFIVIPGTIVGDMLVRWMKDSNDAPSERASWSPARFYAIAALMIAFQGVILVGLYNRWVSQTVFVCLALFALGGWMMRRPKGENEKFLSRLYSWGVFWLLLGLFFEPYEGGIKKDPAVMSYYFVTTGLAIFLLIAFAVIGDIRGRRRWLGLLAANGQNPMIAYIGASNLVLPLFALTRLNKVYDLLTPTPWTGFLGGCFVTLLVALAVCFFTRRKIFWRT